MRIAIGLGDTERLRRSRQFAETIIVPILEALITIDRDWLARNPRFRLYRSGIRYEMEPPGIESFDDIPTMLRRGNGDCDDLCGARIAELRQRGENAQIRIKWRRLPTGQKLYHVQVRRADGTIEDPSRILGMR